MKAVLGLWFLHLCWVNITPIVQLRKWRLCTVSDRSEVYNSERVFLAVVDLYSAE